MRRGLLPRQARMGEKRLCRGPGSSHSRFPAREKASIALNLRRIFQA